MLEYSAPLQVTTPPELSIGDLLADWAAKDPERTLFERQQGGVWAPMSAREIHETVTGIAKGLIAAGLQPGDRLGIMARTTPEWTLIDFGAWYAGLVTVPVYETSSADQTAWILSNSGARGVVVENAGHAAVVAEARAEVPSLEHVWQLDDGAIAQLTAAGAEVPESAVRERRDALRTDDLATIIYTSGTTGRPKGAELTHANFVELTSNAISALGKEVLGPGSRTLLFMPLAHVFARFISVLTIAAGVPCGHTPDTKNLIPDIGSFRPTFILSVPRVFEKVYNSAEANAAAGGKLKIFHWAARAAISYSRSLDDPKGAPLSLKLQYKVADTLVLSKLRAVLGGQAEFAISGGAPLGERLGHFFRGVGIKVLEGYGLTETTAPIGVNVPAKVKIGTVGPPLPGLAVKIDEDGEILTKGVGVFRGYHDNPEATAEAIQDGWFHTGDIGELDSDGYLRITGRKKEIIVTAAGKNVAPAVLEDNIRAHPLVSQCVVVGDQRPFIAALITLDPEMLPGWLSSRGLPDMDLKTATTDPAVREALQGAVDRANRKVSRAESIREFVVLDTDFTIENDYLTPSLKVKRNLVVRDYAQAIDDLYANAAAHRAHDGAASA